MSLDAQLIVTADDFGASPDVNDAVLRAHREGVLRFASLMVGEAAAEDAVARARRECPRLGLGLHVTLCQGRASASVSRIPGLVDAAGRFHDNPVWCGIRYFFDRGLEAQLEIEVRAQFERFLAFGLRPGHADGHLNIHAHPVIFPLVMRLSREYGFHRVRLPGGELWAAVSRAGGSWRHLADGFVLGLMRAYLLRAWGHPEIAVPGRVYGVLRSGLMTEEYALACLKGLPGGVSEMYFHPSADPASAVTSAATPTHRTITELETLLSSRLLQEIKDRGIYLVDGTAA
ncbi:MAG: hopanoid biosynthesis-associated protein HpnK [Elusimicrobia bacterium]|nr:hopanoid biosynthesis-associated protein HpnK [Elusimicrobiota bacterium]